MSRLCTLHGSRPFCLPVICCGITGYSRNNWLHDVNRTYCVRELSVEDSKAETSLYRNSQAATSVLLIFFGTHSSSHSFFSFPQSVFISSPFSASFFCLLVSSLCLLIHPNRSQSADSGSMCMMNWAGTPAAQVLPRVRGDTTRGELLCSAVTHDTLLLFIHIWNSLHRPQGLNSPTSASNVISQWFIHNIRTLQDKY